MTREPVAEPASASVEEEERESDDDRGERERQIDERVEQTFEREVAAHDREPDGDPEDRVDRDGDGRDLEREHERVDGRGVRERAPDVPDAVVEGPPADDGDRPHQHDEQVEESEAAQGEAAKILTGHARTWWRSVGWLR